MSCTESVANFINTCNWKGSWIFSVTIIEICKILFFKVISIGKNSHKLQNEIISKSFQINNLWLFIMSSIFMYYLDLKILKCNTSHLLKKKYPKLDNLRKRMATYPFNVLLEYCLTGTSKDYLGLGAVLLFHLLFPIQEGPILKVTCKIVCFCPVEMQITSLQ